MGLTPSQIVLQHLLPTSLDVQPTNENGYAGELYVGCTSEAVAPFQLEAVSLAIHSDGAVFEFTGRDDPTRGDFFVSGSAAFSSEHQRFVCPEAILSYSLDPDSQAVRTRLSFEVRELKDGEKSYCYISGDWRDGDGGWIFHGLLPRSETSTSW